MNTPHFPRSCPWLLGLSIGLLTLVTAPAQTTIVGPATVTGGTSTGNLNVTGTIDNIGNSFVFGTQGASYGGALLYNPSTGTDTFTFSINYTPGSWLWVHNTSVPAMRLDSSHNLLLYPAGANLTTTPASITLSPAASPSIALGTATLSNVSGVLTTSGALTVGGNLINTTGTLTGGATGLTLNSGGTNQNITLTPSGSGNTILNGNVGIGTTNPTFKLDVLNNNYNAIRASGNSTNSVGIYVQNTTTNGRQWALLSAGGGPAGGVGSFSIWDDSGGGNRFNITPAGNVGIGTISADKSLHVSFDSASVPAVKVGSGTDAQGWYTFLGNDTAGATTSYIGNAYNNDAAAFQIRMKGTVAAAARLTVLGNGNVGIGTPTPGTGLSLKGAFTPAYMQLAIQSTTGDDRSGISFWNAAGSARLANFYAGADGNSYLNGAEMAGSIFHIYSGGGEKMTFLPNGNVGIGTATPPGKLTLNGPGGAAANNGLEFFSTGNTSGYGGWVGRIYSGVPTGGWATAPFTFAVPDGSGGEIKTMTMLNGNVGIGTTNPGLKTEIANGGTPYNLYLSGLAPSLYFGSVSGTFPNSAANPAAGFVAFSGANGHYGQGQGDLNIATQSYGSGNTSAINFLVPSNDSGAYSNAVRITRAGNVGIGTTNPTQKLSVAGTIQAYEVIVNTGWADYVFDSNYRLAPLSEVEQHIKAEKHLPGIPSAQEIAAHGVSMGDMQSKLLSKIEELTLHMIAQEKRMELYEKENATLRQQVSELKTSSTP